jgi:hypothetical protein
MSCARKKPRRDEFLVDAGVTTELMLTSHQEAGYSRYGQQRQGKHGHRATNVWWPARRWSPSMPNAAAVGIQCLTFFATRKQDSPGLDRAGTGGRAAGNNYSGCRILARKQTINLDRWQLSQQSVAVVQPGSKRLMTRLVRASRVTDQRALSSWRRTA